ncbi:hypothetical protein BL470_005057 [Escherichia coli]|nr:hypothetical protein [Salmonella enterica subsp. enterica serovar Uganda]ECI7719529.1 hypothetical protein [Salmonella enterica subsp. enterica]EFG4742113.1 hypothetical protein [Escherichia coli]EFG8199856.1 hypothetical protein [Escherichia coli]EFG9152747.1 hypothetical protein [Escherichia coli]
MALADILSYIKFAEAVVLKIRSRISWLIENSSFSKLEYRTMTMERRKSIYGFMDTSSIAKRIGIGEARKAKCDPFDKIDPHDSSGSQSTVEPTQAVLSLERISKNLLLFHSFFLSSASSKHAFRFLMIPIWFTYLTILPRQSCHQLGPVAIRGQGMKIDLSNSGAQGGERRPRDAWDQMV